MRHLSGATLLLLVAYAAPARAQLPAGSRYAAVAADTLSNGWLYAFDAAGLVTTVQPLPFQSPVSLEMAPTNDALLIWQHTALWRYDLGSGMLTATPLTGTVGPVTWGALDEDGGMIWGESFGSLFKADDLAGSNTRALRGNNRNLHAIGAWNGTTGGYVQSVTGIVIFLSGFHFLDRTGVSTLTLTGPLGLSGIDWNPWTSDVWFIRPDSVNPNVGRVTQAGGATLIGPPAPLSNYGEGIKVRDQPFEEGVCVEGLAFQAPDYLYTLSPAGTATTLATLPMNVGLVDVELLGSRPLWAAGPWVAGSVGNLTLSFGAAHAGAPYLVALSLSHLPGIPVGPAGVAHLAFDPLTVLSFQTGPPLFNNFLGVLDASGRANPPPSVTIPPSARGVRVFGAAVTIGGGGVAAVSNAWGITIQ